MTNGALAHVINNMMLLLNSYCNSIVIIVSASHLRRLTITVNRISRHYIVNYTQFSLSSAYASLRELLRDRSLVIHYRANAGLWLKETSFIRKY